MHWYVQVRGQNYGPYSKEQMQGFVSEGRVTAASMISNAPENGFFAASGYDVFALWSGTGQISAVAAGGGMRPVAMTQPSSQPEGGVYDLQNLLDEPVSSTAQEPSASHAPQSSRRIEQPAPHNQDHYQPSQHSWQNTQRQHSAPISTGQQPDQFQNHVPVSSKDVRPEYKMPEPIETQQFGGQSTTQPGSAPRPKSSVFVIMAEIRSNGAMEFLRTVQAFGTAQRIGDTVWVLRSAASAEQLRNSLSQSLSRQDRLFILDGHHNKTAWFNIGADLDNRIREIWTDEDQ